jgi:hypothetical protein
MRAAPRRPAARARMRRLAGGARGGRGAGAARVSGGRLAAVVGIWKGRAAARAAAACGAPNAAGLRRARPPPPSCLRARRQRARPRAPRARRTPCRPAQRGLSVDPCLTRPARTRQEQRHGQGAGHAAREARHRCVNGVYSLYIALSRQFMTPAALPRRDAQRKRGDSSSRRAEKRSESAPVCGGPCGEKRTQEAIGSSHIAPAPAPGPRRPPRGTRRHQRRPPPGAAPLFGPGAGRAARRPASSRVTHSRSPGQPSHEFQNPREQARLQQARAGGRGQGPTAADGREGAWGCVRGWCCGGSWCVRRSGRAARLLLRSQRVGDGARAVRSVLGRSGPRRRGGAGPARRMGAR